MLLSGLYLIKLTWACALKHLGIDRELKPTSRKRAPKLNKKIRCTQMVSSSIYLEIAVWISFSQEPVDVRESAEGCVPRNIIRLLGQISSNVESRGVVQVASSRKIESVIN